MERETENLTYDEIVGQGLILETRGDYSRYWIGDFADQETIWVNDVACIVADPDHNEEEEDEEEDGDATEF